ncbi:ferric-dicitrate binding protein FerR (iron transport regulator) [Pedobacter cryoconitis]|uniref:Ferric-dicitrate binding protein FerR (Iron transport regulator) n=1 Tax=Pedobacter cryoconitis TaxID=188932 RepID=A0A7W9DYV2_9SPHI|nr:FecR family protein [Pedobacter cryoconitis]MBB5636321.1 ferric-dicitrate binding protein FerR (iron transport regulator) [Pedobacter cryoconitis]
MNEDYLRKLVKRYLDKKSTDEELEVFVYLMKQGKLDQYIQEVMDTDIKAATDINIPQPAINHPKKGPISLYLKIAASILLVSGLISFLYFYKNDKQQFTAINTISINNHTGIIYKEVLPDGTQVWLNPNASLSYPSKFGKFREVTMQGEAFFNVTKDHQHPFIITSGNVLTKVWGTSFRIRSIPGENSTKVSVLTGKVSVSIPVKASTTLKEPEEVILLPQQEATYQKTVNHLLKTPVSPSSDLKIWNNVNLSFENATIEQVTKILSQHYNLQIQAQGKQLNEYRLTADFTDKNLADILFLICRSVHTTYVRNDQQIILKN